MSYDRARPCGIFEAILGPSNAPWVCWGAPEHRYGEGEEVHERNALIIAAEAVRRLTNIARDECERIYFVRIGGRVHSTESDPQPHLTVVLFRKDEYKDENGHDIHKFAHIHVPVREIHNGISFPCYKNMTWVWTEDTIFGDDGRQQVRCREDPFPHI